MLRLTLAGIKDRAAWEEIGVTLPRCDIAAMRAHTENAPVWVHFGAGNIFRAYIARLQQELLDEGLAKSGIVVAETYDTDIIGQIYEPYDNLALVVSLNPDGNTGKTVVAGVAEALRARPEDAGDMERLTAVFGNPALQIASFTITEKGYALRGMQGELLPAAEADMEGGPDRARTAMGCLTALVYRRYRAGGYPLALLSLDNCSRNGEKLKDAVTAIAAAWRERGYADDGFIAYLADEGRVSFPWSMIDKITPRPSADIAAELEGLGIADMAPVKTDKNTYIAPFVNAEVPEYLVIEDRFPNGRPPLERAGVYMTDRDTVNKVERMKVTTCLNPLHTALAVYGCLLGYESIAGEMKDRDLVRLVEGIGYRESLPVVEHPGILEPVDFLREVMEARLPNPYIPDTPQRIATDTSQKIPIRFGETIKAYMQDADRDPGSLVAVPLAIAGWLRYLLGVDDDLNPMALSPDPQLDDMRDALKGITAGRPETYGGELKSILRNPVLFAVDLYAAGLGDKIEAVFLSLIAGKGAVRRTLQKYLGE